MMMEGEMKKTKFKAIKISSSDNVAVVVQPTLRGQSVTVPDSGESVVVNQDIPLGHKIALARIAKGEDILRYGEVIGIAAKGIKPGDWVHSHNTSER